MEKRFLIIGTGFIFPIHVEAIRTVGGKIREVINTVYGLDHWKEVLGNSDADYVVILTPNDLHVSMIQEAVRLGKTVLCEKPIAISVEDAHQIIDLPNVFSVLQLRHHPLVNSLKHERGNGWSEVTMDISVHRDEKYDLGWKGSERSGGILFNLGIHYFDMLQYIFGFPREVTVAYADAKTVEGRLRGKKYACNFRISTAEPKATQRRVFTVNGNPYNFSSKENLSYENLHRFVYQDLVNGHGTTVKDCLPAIELIDQIKMEAIKKTHDSTVNESLAVLQHL
jgi:UDP-N-acetyl-2-amino-2-deoxyglucuronate dehydrogenase